MLKIWQHSDKESQTIAFCFLITAETAGVDIRPSLQKWDFIYFFGIKTECPEYCSKKSALQWQNVDEITLVEVVQYDKSSWKTHNLMPHHTNWWKNWVDVMTLFEHLFRQRKVKFNTTSKFSYISRLNEKNHHHQLPPNNFKRLVDITDTKGAYEIYDKSYFHNSLPSNL